jgi:hypothetical protein
MIIKSHNFESKNFVFVIRRRGRKEHKTYLLAPLPEMAPDWAYDYGYQRGEGVGGGQKIYFLSPSPFFTWWRKQDPILKRCDFTIHSANDGHSKREWLYTGNTELQFSFFLKATSHLSTPATCKDAHVRRQKQFRKTDIFTVAAPSGDK